MDGTKYMKKLAGIKCFRGIDLHVVHEQGMVSSCRYNTNFDPVIRVPVQKLIIHKHLKEKIADHVLIVRIYIMVTQITLRCRI